MSSFSLPEDFDLGEHFDHRTLIRAMELKPQQAVAALSSFRPACCGRMTSTTVSSAQV